MSTDRRGVEPTSIWSPESGALRWNGMEHTREYRVPGLINSKTEEKVE